MQASLKVYLVLRRLRLTWRWLLQLKSKLRLHKPLVLGHQGIWSLYGGIVVVWYDTMELTMYYPSDTKNFEMAPRYLKNLWTRIMRRKLVSDVWIERCYILYINSVSGTVGQEVMHLCLFSEALYEVRNCDVNVSWLQCGMAGLYNLTCNLSDNERLLSVCLYIHGWHLWRVP